MRAVQLCAVLRPQRLPSRQEGHPVRTVDVVVGEVQQLQGGGAVWSLDPVPQLPQAREKAAKRRAGPSGTQPQLLKVGGPDSSQDKQGALRTQLVSAQVK